MKLPEVYSDRTLDFDKETAPVWASLYNESEKKTHHHRLWIASLQL